MTIKLGSSNIDKIYAGSAPVAKAYLGTTLVYDAAGAAASGPITGLEISITSHHNWIGVVELGVWDDSDTNIIASLTPQSGEDNSFDDIASGAFGTNSVYNTQEDKMIEGWPVDGNVDMDPGTNSAHWNSKTSGGSAYNPMKIFIKATSAFTLSKVGIVLAGGYGSPNFYTIVFRDDLGNVLTPASGPSAEDEYVFMNGARRGFEWTF